MCIWRAALCFYLASRATGNPTSVQNGDGGALLPFAGETFTLQVVGTGLTLADRIRIVEPTVQCGQSGASSGVSSNLASLTQAGSAGTSGFTSTSQQWSNLIVPAVQMWKVCWCGPPSCTEDFDFNVQVSLFSAIGPSVKDSVCYLTETCVIQLGGSQFSNTAGLAVLAAGGSCSNPNSPLASWNGITNPKTLSGTGDGSSFIMSAFSTSDIIKPEGTKQMCWSYNHPSSEYVVFVGNFQMFPSGSPIQQRCTLAVLCSILLSGDGFSSTNQLLISSETVCGRTGRPVLNGFTNPQAPANSVGFDTYEFGTALSGTPGVFKLCWAHNPTMPVDWLFLLNVGEISICGPLGFGTATGGVLLPTLIEVFTMEVRGVCLSIINRVRIVSQTTQCGSNVSLFNSDLLNGPLANTADLAGIAGSSGDGGTARAWHNLSVPQPAELRVCWCPGSACLQGIDFRIHVGDFLVRGPSATQLTPESGVFIAGGEFVVQLHGSNLEPSDRIRILDGAVMCGTGDSIMTMSLSAHSLTILNEVTSSGSTGNIATSMRWQNLRLDEAGEFRICWCGRQCTNNSAFLVDVGTLNIAGPQKRHNVVCMITEACSIHLHGTGLSSSNAIILIASSTCGDPQAKILSWAGITNPKQDPVMNMTISPESVVSNSSVYSLGIARAGPVGTVAHICWAGSRSASLVDFTVLAGSFVMHGPRRASVECELGLPCTHVLNLTGSLETPSFVRVAPLGGCDSSLNSSLIGLSTAQVDGTYALGTAVRGDIGIYDLCWWIALATGPPMHFGTLSMIGPSRLADGSDSILRPLRDAFFTLEIVGKGMRPNGQARIVQSATHCGAQFVASGTEYLGGSLQDQGIFLEDGNDTSEMFTHLSWQNLTLSSIGTYRVCWCARRLSCKSDHEFNVDVGIFVVPSAWMQLDPKPIAGEFFCVSLHSKQLLLTDRLRLIGSANSCGDGGNSLFGAIDLDSLSSPHQSRMLSQLTNDSSTTFGQSSMMVSTTVSQGNTTTTTTKELSLRWCSLKLHYATEIRGCWCGSSCASPEDYVMDVGLFAIFGPRPLGEVTCFPTAPCVVEVVGSGFVASNSIVVISTGTCGDAGASLRSWANVTNPQISSIAAATTTVFDLGTPVEVPSSPESASGVVCWSHAPADIGDLSEYSVFIGAFSIRGPKNASLECFSSKLCSLRLQGTGLGAESVVTVIDTSSSCEIGHSVLTSSVPMLLQSSVQTSLVVGAYHFGTVPGDVYGSFQLCWRFKGSIGPSLAIGFANFVGPRLIADGTGAAIQAYAGQNFTLEVLGSLLAETNRVRIFYVNSLTCGASGSALFSSAVTDAGKMLLQTNGTAGSTGDVSTSVQWTSLSLKLAGSFQVCWCHSGACVQDDDFFGFAGTFSLFGPVEVATVSPTSLTEIAAMAGISFVLELRGAGLTNLDGVKIIDGDSSCDSQILAVHALENPTVDIAGSWLRWSSMSFVQAAVYQVCWCSPIVCSASSIYPIHAGSLQILGIQPKDVECVVTNICTFQMDGTGLANTNRLLVIAAGSCSAGIVNAVKWEGMNNPGAVFLGTGTYILGTAMNGTTSVNHPLCWQSDPSGNWVQVGTFGMLGPNNASKLSVSCTVGQSCSTNLSVAVSLSSGSLLISSTTCGANAVAVNVPGLENPRPSLQRFGDVQHYDFGTISTTLSSTDSLFNQPYMLCWAALVGISSRSASEHSFFAGYLELFGGPTTSTTVTSTTQTTSTTTNSTTLTSTTSTTSTSSASITTTTRTSSPSTAETVPEPAPGPEPMSEVRCDSIPDFGGIAINQTSFADCVGMPFAATCSVKCLDGSSGGHFVCNSSGNWAGEASCSTTTIDFTTSTATTATSTKQAVTSTTDTQILECPAVLNSSWHRELSQCSSRSIGDTCEALCSEGFAGANGSVVCVSSGSWSLGASVTDCTKVIDDSKVIVLTMTLHNVSHSMLIANSSLLASFKKTLAQVFADAAGDGIEQEHISIELSPGSVIVQATITPPATVEAEVVSSNIGAASSSLGDAVLLGVQALDGFSAVTTGEVAVAGIEVTVVSPTLPTEPPLEHGNQDEASSPVVLVIGAILLAVILCGAAVFVFRSPKTARYCACCDLESCRLGCLRNASRSTSGHTKVPSADSDDHLLKLSESMQTEDGSPGASTRADGSPGANRIGKDLGAVNEEPVDSAVKEQSMLPPDEKPKPLDDVILAALLSTVEEDSRTPAEGTAGDWDVDELSDAPPNVPEPMDDLFATDQLDDLFGKFTRK